jgi:predicted dehydrogenase/nucleoside-diphosphate-sugar epimerase
MQILVTGASGFIGRRLVERLRAAGHRVTVLLRVPAAMALPRDVTVAAGDITEAAAVARAAAGCEAIVHLANATGVTDAARARAINVGGTDHVLAAARAAGGIRVIFTSTVSAMREQLGPYGSTKREAEEHVRAAGVPFVILRPSLVYGGNVGLVATLIGHLRGLPVMPVIGNGRIEIDPIHIDDVCAVIEACLTRDDVLGRSYDLLGPERVSFNDLLRRIAASIGVERRLLHVPGPAALALARLLGRVMAHPPLTVDNVLGLTSPARLDHQAARRDFAIDWTPLDAGLRQHTEPRAALVDIGLVPSPLAASAARPTPALLEMIAAAPEFAPGVGARRPLRVALVGLGRMGVAHATVLSMLPDVQLVAAVDSAPAAARQLRGMGFQVPVLATLDAALAERLDAAWICTPPDSHLALARACLAAGVAVFIEKPLAQSLDAARALAALATPGAPPVACGYTLAFWPSFVAAGAVLRSGALGAVQRVQSSMHISQVFGPQRGWQYERARSGGGVVANLSSHLLYLLRDWFGMPSEVRASWQQLYTTVEDELRATLVAPGCAEIQFESSWCVPGYPISVTSATIEGSNGRLTVNNDALLLELASPAAGLPAGATRVVEADLPQPAAFVFNGEAYALEDAHFLRWVSGGAAAPISAAAGLDVQRIMDALYASAAADGAPQAVLP